MNNSEGWVKIEREFNASIDDVWKMWTDPDAFKKWYGPMGMSVPIAEMDVVVGGTRKICMARETAKGSMSMWFIGVYKDVQKPVRLVYTESMCMQDGTLISPQSMGMPEETPQITEVNIELRESGGKTFMTLVHFGVREGTAGGGGWMQAFDKLADMVAAGA